MSPQNPTSTPIGGSITKSDSGSEPKLPEVGDAVIVDENPSIIFKGTPTYYLHIYSVYLYSMPSSFTW